MADSKTVIAARLELEAGSANANLKDFNAGVKDSKKNLTDLGATAEKTGKDVAGTGGHFGKLKDQMTSLPGPLGAASDGVGKLGGAFKALLANPVGLVILAIVAALALLYKSFTNTFAGGQKVEQIFAGLKAAAQALFDNIGHLASAIDKLFHFDFSGAVAEIKGVVKAAGDAYSAMAKLTQQAQALHKEQLANDLDAAERAKRLAILREQATDESIPIAKRKALLKELQADAEDNAKKDIDLAKQTTENRIAQLSLQKDGAQKNQDEINELRIKQIQVETDNANELRRIGKQITGAEKAEDAERKTIHDEQVARIKKLTEEQKKAAKERQDIIDKEIEAARKQMKTDIENAAAQIKDQEEQNAKAAAAAVLAGGVKEIDPNMIRAQNAILANDLIKQSEQEKTDFVLALAETEAQGRITLASSVANALGTLSDIVGKQSAAGKALAIAQTTIATFQAGFAAFKGMVTSIPGPVGIALGVVAAAGALASGIAAVKKIVAVQIPGGGAGGSTPGTIPLPAAPVAPTQSSTTLDQNALNGIGSAVGSHPARAYVLASDIEQDANLSVRLNRAARIN